jgi:hypothetical protein
MPGAPGKTLVKNTGSMVELYANRSIVGKIMYYATKIAPAICNAVRELAGHLSNPGAEHWKAIEQMCWIPDRHWNTTTMP